MTSITIHRSEHTLVVALVICALLTLGCDRSPKHYPVAGTITLDGDPVTGGEIIFFFTEGGPPDSGLIEDGVFAFESLAGPMRVEITATRDHPTRKVPGGSPGTWVPAPVNYIPERYRGADSELQIGIPRGGDRQIVFELRSED